LVFSCPRVGGERGRAQFSPERDAVRVNATARRERAAVGSFVDAPMSRALPLECFDPRLELDDDFNQFGDELAD
jgi:hypothetical protein